MRTHVIRFSCHHVKLKFQSSYVILPQTQRFVKVSCHYPTYGLCSTLVKFLCCLDILTCLHKCSLLSEVLRSTFAPCEHGCVALESQSSPPAFFRHGFSKFYIIQKFQILFLLELKYLCSSFSVLAKEQAMPELCPRPLLQRDHIYHLLLWKSR